MKNKNIQKKYLKSKGIKCPVCNSDQINGDSFDSGGGIASQDMRCTDCDSTWTDNYSLSGISNLSEGKVPCNAEKFIKEIK